MTETVVANDYDAVPYESYPYANTHPENLYTIGRLFSMSPVLPKKCKVLELGCASAGNIIPMAIKYPDSEFVGVDLSKVQIDEGNKHIEKLGLKNLKLNNISITDIDESFGKFDYIVVHGILSWVPKNVQDAIFRVCNENLTENGIAYVSYNTLPGWSIVKGIREMMLYHTKGFESPVDKVREARLLLKFIKDGNAQDSNPYSDFIQREIDTLSTVGDSYLAHDHLEENNEPFYFSDFMENATGNDLQYLGDSSISTMFIGNLPKEVTDSLKSIGNDIVRTEQYMDFIRNRRFRSTLLCKKGIALNRNLGSDTLKGFYIQSALTANTDLTNFDFTSNQPVTFKSAAGASISTPNQATIAALQYLSGFTTPVQIDEVVSKVKERFSSSMNAEVVEKTIYENMLQIFLSNGLSIHSFPVNYVKSLSDKPKTSELARYQATYSNWVTSQNAQKVIIDTFGRILSQHLNGENDFDSIVNHMIDHVVKKDLTLSANGNEVTDKGEIVKQVTELTRKSMAAFAPNALLVA